MGNPNQAAVAANPELAAIMAELQALKAENNKLKTQVKLGGRKLYFKPSKKGTLSLYGLQAYRPVSYYASQWETLLAMEADIRLALEVGKEMGALALSKKDKIDRGEAELEALQTAFTVKLDEAKEARAKDEKAQAETEAQEAAA